MTALFNDEVAVGLVAWLNQHVLHADERVLATTQAAEDRLAPFVCCFVASDRSGWAAITSRSKRERIELKKDWRSGGTDDAAATGRGSRACSRNTFAAWTWAGSVTVTPRAQTRA